jgi:chaperone protein EcpD
MFLKPFSAALRTGACLLALFSLPGQASVVISGTRVVYPGSEKEITVKLTNSGTLPVLVQSWVDTGDVKARPEKIQVPFILTPPINRINPSKSQTLRLSYTATPALPEDRESVYWLNVLEIPPVTKEAAPNRLQVAFRTRIKLFYRPAALADKEKANEAGKQLRWSVNGGELRAGNASPYFVSLVSVTVKQGSRKTTAEGEMVPPRGDRSFRMKDGGLVRSGAEVIWQYINDWGAVETEKGTL